MLAATMSTGNISANLVRAVATTGAVIIVLAVVNNRKKKRPHHAELATPRGYTAVLSGLHLERGALLGNPAAESISEMGEWQVGGHKADSKGNRGMLLWKPNVILKPFQSGARGLREVSVYEEIEFLRENEHGLKHLHGLERYLPEYHGVIHFNGCEHIAFTDCTASMSKPCVMDLKLGANTFEEDASEAKMRKELAKYPRQAEAGFRFVGTRSFVCASGAANDEYISVGKKDYLKVEPEGARSVLRNFFTLSTKCRKSQLNFISAVVGMVDELVGIFVQQTRFTFTSSSLLIAYDASFCVGDGMHVSHEVVVVKLIDLAHVRHAKGRLDASTLHGLRQFKSLLNEVFEELKLKASFGG